MFNVYIDMFVPQKMIIGNFRVLSTLHFAKSNESILHSKYYYSFIRVYYSIL